MLLIVFGAGASYDALPDYAAPDRQALRLPLANGLFDLRFAADLGQFPEATALAPHLRDLPSGTSIEVRLDEFAQEAVRHDERSRQMMAIRFYLQFMLSRVDREWNELGLHTTNYRTLLDEARMLVGDRPVAIVTFNYDRMVEWCLGDMQQPLNNLADYTSGGFKLFKVHGSVDWAHVISRPLFSSKGGWSLARSIIQGAPDVELGPGFAITDSRPIQEFDGMAAVPALAVPLQSKQEFEMPSDHLTLLRGLLPEVTKVLIIGWKGADLPFRRELAAIKSAEGVVVSPKGAEETLANLADCSTIRLQGIEATFTQYVRDRRVRELLR